MAIYNEESNQYSDGRDSEVSFTPKYKIPTAEEFLKKHNWTKDYPEMLREFTILHVEAALKAASEKAEWKPISKFALENLGARSCEVDKTSILSAYPLELIK